MFDFSVSGIKLTWDAFRGLWRFIFRNKRRLTPTARLELRQKWKPHFEEFYSLNRQKRLSTEVIIRNISKIDDYPDANERNKNGISPWFKVSIAQTYERGFMVILSIGELISIGEDLWRFRDWLNGEKGEKFYCIGFVPYENIVDVDWKGDNYYDYPHIYCFFDLKRRQPYERVMLCTQWDFDGVPQYREVVKIETVKKTSRKFGLRYFG